MNNFPYLHLLKRYHHKFISFGLISSSPHLCVTAGFLCLLLCDELPQSD